MASCACKSCGEPFENYHELAIHISGMTKGHYHSKKWAAKYLLIYGLSAKNKVDHKERTPLSDEDREARDNNKRELSGVTEVTHVCCSRCKRIYSRVLEIEYINSPHALTDKSTGYLSILCVNCGGK